MGWSSMMQQHLPIALSVCWETLGMCPLQELWHTGQEGNQAAEIAQEIQASIQIKALSCKLPFLFIYDFTLLKEQAEYCKLLHVA